MTARHKDDILFLEVANVTNFLFIDFIFLTHRLSSCVSTKSRFLPVTVLAFKTMFSDLIALTEHLYLFKHLLKFLNYQGFFLILWRQLADH